MPGQGGKAPRARAGGGEDGEGTALGLECSGVELRV